LKVLYGVSSVGLGHARRSLTLANKIRKLGDYEIDWVASVPARSFLEGRGEKVLPVSSRMKTLSSAMEDRVSQGRLKDISLVARKSSALSRENYNELREFLGNYEALIQDEFVETMFSFMWDRNPPLPRKRVVITDYFQIQTNTWNPLSRVVTWYANRMLAKAYGNSQLRIFADEAESTPKKLPKFEIVGPILEQVPDETREDLRRKLFSGDNRMIVVVTVGGTSIGKRILDFIASNEKSIREGMGNAKLILMLGPRIDRNLYPENSENLEFVPFTTEALSYFKAADCVVAQAGGSTLNEVASLGTPCVAIPIKNHWEQQVNARKFSKEYGFQLLQYDELNVGSVVNAVRIAMNSKYEPKRSDGAERAAKLVSDFLKN